MHLSGTKNKAIYSSRGQRTGDPAANTKKYTHTTCMETRTRHTHSHTMTGRLQEEDGGTARARRSGYRVLNRLEGRVAGKERDYLIGTSGGR